MDELQPSSNSLLVNSLYFQNLCLNPEFLEAVEYVNNRSVKVLSDMNTPFESWKSWLLGLSPIPRSIDKLYRKRQNSEIHIRLYSFPPSVPRAMLLSISNANSISTTVS
jgi:hypothetical protein